MKNIVYITLLLFAFTVQAQQQNDDCQLTIETTEEGDEIKSTKDYLMYEKVFGDTSQFLFFSLTNSAGTPLLNFQLLSKSKGFTPQVCLNQNSRIFIQLTNNKIVTLISAVEEQCSALVYDTNEKNNLRILTGTFLFTKGNFEDLEKSAVSFIRVQYATESVDYPIKKELTSETSGTVYQPETYFINHLKCLE
ncbi:hypothetical protein [Flavobacterium rhizosphaerae]|uniref:Uncharacterized protein n=1 Tax=Flavobacterium rhizosphaerae TaxID=3163298 RepID=A0ABW8YZ02_9FLAO